jgi:GTP cyclohydrolase IA
MNHHNITEAEVNEALIRTLIRMVGEDPKREGLLETPKRVVKAWEEWTSGYKQDPVKILKTFEDGGEKYDSMVLVKDLPFYSHCEHHLAPFFGTVSIAYIPNKRVVGLSKFQRLVEVFARRLQVQERITVQIAETLDTVLRPRGVGVLIKARHLCMESRGICKQGSVTVTSALRGSFLKQAKVREEFMMLVK